jgi:hypothetical protein
VKVGRNFINYFLQGLKQVVQSKEEDLQQRELLHNKQMAELNEANQELQQRFDKVIVIYVLRIFRIL